MSEDLIKKEDEAALTFRDGDDGETTNVKIDSKNKRLLLAAKKILDKRIGEVSTKRQESKDNESINESDLSDVLTKEDYIYYQVKKELYLSAYPELTDPFDLDDVHLLIMEQIFQRNLFKQKKKMPGKDITEGYEKSVKRMKDLKQGLSLRRTDRLKDKNARKQTINIADMSVHFNSREGIDAMQKRIIDMRREENSLDDPDKVVE